MAEKHDSGLDEFHAIRKPGAHLEEQVVPDDFVKTALASKFLPWSEAYLQLVVDGWAHEVAKRYGAETMAEIEWAAWNDQTLPELERMKQEFLPAGKAVSYTHLT